MLNKNEMIHDVFKAAWVSFVQNFEGLDFKTNDLNC